MPRIVILGTGTGVGKTHLACALARALRRTRGVERVVAVKPVETGTQSRRGGAPRPGSDAALLEDASGDSSIRPHPLFALRDPVSVHLAARREGRRVPLQKLIKWLYMPLYGNIWQIVETAGGAFSPIDRHRTNVDLARALDPAIWILVAPDALGVLHDVRASLTALERVARAPDHLVLSGAREPDASTGTNAEELAFLGLPRPAAVLGRSADTGAALTKLVRALLKRRDGP